MVCQARLVPEDAHAVSCRHKDDGSILHAEFVDRNGYVADDKHSIAVWHSRSICQLFRHAADLNTWANEAHVLLMESTELQGGAGRVLYLAMAELLEEATEALVRGDNRTATGLTADASVLGNAMGVLAKRARFARRQ